MSLSTKSILTLEYLRSEINQGAVCQTKEWWIPSLNMGIDATFKVFLSRHPRNIMVGNFMLHSPLYTIFLSPDILSKIVTLATLTLHTTDAVKDLRSIHLFYP